MKRIKTKKVILDTSASMEMTYYTVQPNERILAAHIIDHAGDAHYPHIFYRVEVLLILEVEENDDKKAEDQKRTEIS